MSPKEKAGAKSNVFVFDGDDTLWMNEWQYSQAYSDFFSYLYKIFGNKTPNLHYLQERYFRTEGEMYKEWGIRRGRLAEAMIQTYRDICNWALWRFEADLWREEHEVYIRKIGDQPFDFGRLEWLSGAKSILSYLKRRGHMVCFLSSYDKKVFPQRAEFLGLYEFFSKENILLTEGKKTKDDFVMVSGWQKETDTTRAWYAIGNGESDVLPPLEISENWHGIYIPHGSTSRYLASEYFKEGGRALNFMPPPMENSRVQTIRSIGCLPTDVTGA